MSLVLEAITIDDVSEVLSENNHDPGSNYPVRNSNVAEFSEIIFDLRKKLGKGNLMGYFSNNMLMEKGRQLVGYLGLEKKSEGETYHMNEFLSQLTHSHLCAIAKYEPEQGN